MGFEIKDVTGRSQSRVASSLSLCILSNNRNVRELQPL